MAPASAEVMGRARPPRRRYCGCDGGARMGVAPTLSLSTLSPAALYSSFTLDNLSSWKPVTLSTSTLTDTAPLFGGLGGGINIGGELPDQGAGIEGLALDVDRKIPCPTASPSPRRPHRLFERTWLKPAEREGAARTGRRCHRPRSSRRRGQNRTASWCRRTLMVEGGIGGDARALAPACPGNVELAPVRSAATFCLPAVRSWGSPATLTGAGNQLRQARHGAARILSSRTRRPSRLRGGPATASGSTASISPARR